MRLDALDKPLLSPPLQAQPGWSAVGLTRSSGRDQVQPLSLALELVRCSDLCCRYIEPGCGEQIDYFVLLEQGHFERNLLPHELLALHSSRTLVDSDQKPA